MKRRVAILFVLALVAACSVAIPSTRTAHAAGENPCDPDNPNTPNTTPPCQNGEPFNVVGVWSQNPAAGYVCDHGYTNNGDFASQCFGSNLLTPTPGHWDNVNGSWAPNTNDVDTIGYWFGGMHNLYFYWLYSDGSFPGWALRVVAPDIYNTPWTSNRADYMCFVFGSNPWHSYQGEALWQYDSPEPCDLTNPGAVPAGQWYWSDYGVYMSSSPPSGN